MTESFLTLFLPSFAEHPTLIVLWLTVVVTSRVNYGIIFVRELDIFTLWKIKYRVIPILDLTLIGIGLYNPV